MYKKTRGNLNDGNDIEFLEDRIDSLEKDKFTLAVAGEVKAGKSTFINALLGAEILPSDVLQTSSAIVEIFKSEYPLLKVTYADGKEEPTCDNPKKRLHEICQIDDTYRGIPTTLIDDIIIENDSKLEVNNDFVKSLEKLSGEALQEKHSVIKEYISKRTKDKIPVKIEFGYPLKSEFNELRIVDTPGVNATGGVQNVTFNYLREANAILFVHNIKPIESESFKKFVKDIIPDTSQEMLFLILTHAGDHTNDDVKELHTEAKKQFKDIIPENRIMAVDSLLKLIHCDLDNGLDLTEIRINKNKKKILASYSEQAKEEDKELIDVVHEASQFKMMLKVIDDFSREAPNLQLREILKKIFNGYETQEAHYSDEIRSREDKKKNPQKFEEDIDCIQKCYDKYMLDIKKIKEGLIYKYSGIKSPWQEDIDALKNEHAKLINESSCIESARKRITDAQDALQRTAEDSLKKLIDDLKKNQKETIESFKEEHNITIPGVDLEALEQNSKINAFSQKDKIEKYTERAWYTLWLYPHDKIRCVGTKKVFNNEKFLGNLKRSYLEAFYEEANNLPALLKDIFEERSKLFSEKSKEGISDRQKSLEEIKKKKQSNEELIKEINALKEKKGGIEPYKKQCKEMLENI